MKTKINPTLKNKRYFFGNILLCLAMAGARAQSPTIFVDTTFNLASSCAPNISSHLLQPDGKIVITGAFNILAGSQHSHVSRLNTNGTSDVSFNADTVLKAPVYCSQLQPDGKILVGGIFNGIYFQGPRNFAARLNSNGTLDTSFMQNSGFDNMVRSMLLQPDGKMIVGGYFFNFNGIPSPRVARLTANGSYDAGFAVGTGFDDDIYPMAIQPDGKILIGGSFDSYNGTTAKRLIRLNSNGTVDNGFNTSVGFSGPGTFYVSKIVIQPDGKIIAAGTFTSYNGTPCNNIVRLNSNATVDNTFNMGSGFDDVINEAMIQPDGRILVSGNFSTYNSSAAPKIVRLMPNGAIDNTFNTGAGFDLWVLLLLQADGKIVCSGNPSTYNNQACPRVLRLTNTGSIPTSVNKNSLEMEAAIYPNPVKDELNITVANNGNNHFEMKVSDLLGHCLFSKKDLSDSRASFNLSNMAAGMYIISVSNEQGQSQSWKIIKE